MKRNSGQALLITIMLIAVALTVVLAMSYTSKTDVQLSKLEEENQKALAAAEAGIDALVNQNADASVLIDGSLGDSFKEFSGSATKTAVAKEEFASPLLQPNSHYMLYLADYPGLSTNPFSGTVTIYYSNKTLCNDSSSDALEVTVIYGTAYPYTIERFKVDGGQRISTGQGKYQDDVGYTKDGVSFKCKTSSFSMTYANPKLMIVRSIFNPTRIGFEGSSSLPTQGTIISSEAKTSSGVSKKVQLFQSYPQIPADFFTTSF